MAFTTVKMNVSIPLESTTLVGDVLFDPEQELLLVDQEGYPVEFLNTDLSVYGLFATEDSVWIKGWSEHSGLAQALENAGVISITRSVTVGPFSLPAFQAKITGDFDIETYLALRGAEVHVEAVAV